MVLAPALLPSHTVLSASPVPMSIVCVPGPPIVTAPEVAPVPMVVAPAPALLISTLPVLERTSCVAEPVLNVSVPPLPTRTNRADVIALSPFVVLPNRY